MFDFINLLIHLHKYTRPHHVQALRIQYFIAVVLTEKGSLKESEHILRYG
jgi:hypothetical protein